MTKPSCRYIVKARAAYPKDGSEEIEFVATERAFENEHPIIAREEAFEFRNTILASLFDDCGINIDELGWDSTNKLFHNISEREIRKLINPYLEPDKKVKRQY